MRQVIYVKSFEEKKSTNTGKAYLSLDTDKGKMSLWDIGEAENVMYNTPNYFDVDAETKGKYVNVIKVFGIADKPKEPLIAHIKDGELTELRSIKDEAIAKMADNKNKTISRVSALDNATKICIARGKVEQIQVLNQAKEFLKFIEGENESK